MEPIAVRPARRFDAGAMASLLTALPGRTGPPVDPAALRDWIDGGDIWHVAERGADLRGFQWIGPRSHLPPDTCEIATFMARGETGIAVGSALFEATRRAARARGVVRIVAIHARNNDGARAYYGSRGFEEAGLAMSAALRAGRHDMHKVVTIFRV